MNSVWLTFNYEIKDMQHTNVRITGTIRRNLQITTISHKLIQLHMEKTCFTQTCAYICFHVDMTTIILFTFGIVMIWKRATKDWHVGNIIPLLKVKSKICITLMYVLLEPFGEIFK
ncbi:hypothetical protein T09_5981 [Trichinella sp. T9]|nr:hypothetical protein T09_5981 [Trichinella sp. T9]